MSAQRGLPAHRPAGRRLRKIWSACACPALMFGGATSGMAADAPPAMAPDAPPATTMVAPPVRATGAPPANRDADAPSSLRTTRAPPWLIEPAIQATESVTTNGNGGPSGAERKDAITSILPTVFVAGESPYYKVKAQLGADLIYYARGSQPSHIYPLVNADGTGVLAQRLLFVDASASIRASERDPYAARSGLGSTENGEIVSIYRISPYINYEISPASTFLARYEEIISKGDDGSAANQRSTGGTVRLERKPTPIGGSLMYETHVVRFYDPIPDRFRLDTAKATGDFKVVDELVLGPVVGEERIEFAQEKLNEGLYGAHLLWSPAERTQLAAEVDHRFFGVGWDVNLRHRSAFYTLTAQLSRAPTTSSSTLGAAPSGSALGSFLDQILIGRYPDASERTVVVNSLIANRGLPAGQQGPVNVYASYAQLHTDANVTLVFLGTRNIVSVAVYQSVRRALNRSDDPLDQLVSTASDTRQTGLSFDFNRKLTPLLTLDFTANWSRIRGLGISGEDATNEQTYRLSMVQALSPRTGLSAGLQYDKLDTSATTVASYRATSAFVGVNHKF